MSLLCHLLVGKVSLSTTGGVGGSGSGSGRSHAANRAKAANTATHSTPQKRLVTFIVCVLIFFIVANFWVMNLFGKNTFFSVFGWGNVIS